MKRHPCLRIELWCGSNQTPTGLEKARIRYRKAGKVAFDFDIQTYFDEHEEDGIVFMDGYLYPCEHDVFQVLQSLDANDIEYDNVDLPDAPGMNKLFIMLSKDSHPGVSINRNEFSPGTKGWCSRSQHGPFPIGDKRRRRWIE